MAPRKRDLLLGFVVIGLTGQGWLGSEKAASIPIATREVQFLK
jgi:hypothetical protein